MALAECRDPDFWRAVLSDPDCAPALLGQPVDVLLPILQSPAVLPLASENGGFLFVARDGLGTVFELHTAFRKAGWGKEALAAAKAAFALMFAGGAHLIFTHEQGGLWRTRPPRSFGFRPMGPTFSRDAGDFRLWALTAEAWDASPARARMEMH